ncbi:MAG: IS5 family transposase [Chloroflexi bacterium]|nr:IS5 family transposase [Chloroflexota bacterium]
MKAKLQRQRRINLFGRVSDKVWAVFVKYLPPEPALDRPGRPIVPFRQVLGGIVYRLRTGCQWKAIPAEFGSGSTCHRRFQEWQASGLFEQVWADQVRAYDETRGIAWNWQILDSAIIPAPLGGEKTGKNPTDRAKLDSKRHVLVDRRGVPLALTLSAANAPDYQWAEATLYHLVIRRSWRDRLGDLVVRHFCADKGYDYDSVHRVANRLGYRVHIAHRRRRGEPLPPPITGRRHPERRWVIERTNSWHNRFRALKIRWEKNQRTTRHWCNSPVRSSLHDFWDRL